MLAPARALSDFSFQDGFGRRTRSVDLETGDEIELLEMSSTLVEHPAFVGALSERVLRVANARHASYARVRRLDRPAADRLVLVSDCLPGWRLSELLRVANEENLPIDTMVVIGLLRQLLPAVALYARNNRESAIGNIAPERLLVTPQARLVITEHPFGPAIEKLNPGRERLWREFRVAIAPAAGVPRIDARADAHAVGVVALSLMTGRSLSDDEYPSKLQELVEGLNERREGATVPLTSGMEHWLLRSLQLDSRAAFQSPQEAHLAFESMLASERSYVTTPTALEAFVAQVGALIDRDRIPLSQPPVSPPVPEPALRLVEPPVASPIRATVPPLSMQEPPASPAHALALVPPPAPAVTPEPMQEVPASAPQDVAAPVPLPEPAAPPVSAEEPEPEPTPAIAPSAQRSILGVSSETIEEPAAQAPAFASIASVPAVSSVSSVARSKLALTLVALAMLQSGVLMWLWSHPPGANQSGTGELTVQSRPTSARVIIDGEDHGVTPASVRLQPGAHVLEIRVGNSEPRVLPVTIQAGVQTAQYVELQNVSLTGGLDLRSEPPGAKVTVDGQKRGATPVRLNDLPPGDHDLLFDAPGGTVKQKVHVDAGVTAQVTVRMPVK